MGRVDTGLMHVGSCQPGGQRHDAGEGQIGDLGFAGGIRPGRDRWRIQPSSISAHDRFLDELQQVIHHPFGRRIAIVASRHGLLERSPFQLFPGLPGGLFGDP